MRSTGLPARSAMRASGRRKEALPKVRRIQRCAKIPRKEWRSYVYQLPPRTGRLLGGATRTQKSALAHKRNISSKMVAMTSYPPKLIHLVLWVAITAFLLGLVAGVAIGIAESTRGGQHSHPGTMGVVGGIE